MSNINKKIIVILGPTSSGKTRFGVKLANELNGEIISADSRQVYRGMDIGTGKDMGEYTIKSNTKNKKAIKISCHLIDVVSPKTEFNLAKYQKLVFKAIGDVLNRDKLPIIVGGTGLYLQAVVDNYNLSAVGKDKEFRKKLEKKNIKQLFIDLKKINRKLANSLNESEKKNKRRLIRYMEIGQNKKEKSLKQNLVFDKKYDFLLIGLFWPREIIKQRIYNRLIERLEKEKMVEEVERLHKKEKVSWKRLESFGLEYKYVSLYLQKKIDYEKMVEELNIAIRQFAKRQMTWFRRWEKQGRKINWVHDKKETKEMIKEFLK